MSAGATANLDELDVGHPRFAVDAVDRILARARELNASDVHFHPTPSGLELKWRIDGVLQPAGRIAASAAPNVVARLKVVAELLTYRTDVPQEGRIRGAPGSAEVRVSTFPTLHGERAVVRLFASAERFGRISELGLPGEVEPALRRLLDATSGAVIATGPAGSGKTTTIYAFLRDLAASTEGRRSIATLEDPIEGAVSGVSQSQIDAAAGFDLTTALRSILRQDPEVLVVGEIRDRATAEIAFQAALTGHLLLTTFHAGGTAGAVSRLLDMGIEPYLVRSGLLAVLSQRLARRLCEACSVVDPDEGSRLGLAVDRPRRAVGCAECRSTGYSGRLLLAELLLPEAHGVGPAILERVDSRELERRAVEHGLITLEERAASACRAGWTDPREVRRILGYRRNPLDDL